MIYKLSLTILLLATSFTTKTGYDSVPLDCFDADGMVLLVNPDNVRSKHNIGLLCDHEGFIVKRGDDYIRVNTYDIDDIFLSMTLKQIAEYSIYNLFKVVQLNNGEYKVYAYGELKGGGPYTAYVFYSATKAFCYGTVIAGAGTAIAAAAPAVAVAGGAALAAGSAGASVGAAVVAGAAANGIAAAGATAAAVAATEGAVGVMAMGGGLAAGAAAIETASLGAGAFGMWLPLP